MIFICIFKIFARAKQFTMHKRMKGKSTFCRFLYCQLELIGYARPILWLYIHESLFHFLIANLDIIRFDTIEAKLFLYLICKLDVIIFWSSFTANYILAMVFFYFWTCRIRKYMSYCTIFLILVRVYDSFCICD